MIPLKIETLLSGRVVEKDSVEYKTGWNPNDTICTICAFANDYNNMNGGYVVIGVEEQDGIPQLPPVGVPKEDLDKIQKEIFQYCNQIVPRYIPRIEVVDYQNTGVYLLYLWCSAGDSGPYQAPKNVYVEKGQKVDKSLKYWIRPASVTVEAKRDELADLFDKFNSVPFDDRVNRKAKLSDIRRGYLEDFIRKSNSALVEQLDTSTIEELLLAEEVVNETDAGVDIRNIGILMFSERPDKLIPGAYIELIRFNTSEAEASDDFIEKTFTGPIWKQVQDALDYINTNVIVEKVVKINGRAEAERYVNYPFNALEEAVVNAVFHKSYREKEPVEIRIYVDSIQILNYPGLDKWINPEKFAAGKVKARKYRNRRIGEMFKEIDLSEKKGTGIPKILKELRANGSPEPEFDMDDSRTYLNTIIHVRSGFEINGRMSESMSELMSELMSESMSELERSRLTVILEYLHEHEKINSAKAAELLNVNPKTAGRLLSGSEKLGILSSEGKTKLKVYRIK